MLKIFLLLLKFKINFKKLNNDKILLLDVIFKDILETIFNKKIEILKIRYEELNFYILIKLIFSKKKKNFFNYVVTYIETVKPKLIITGMDNLIWFYKLKFIFPEIKFVSIQNGFRNKLFFEQIKKEKNLSCDFIFTFSKNVSNLYKKYISTKTIEIGSIKNNFINKKKNKKKKTILFISGGFEQKKNEKHIYEDNKTFFFFNDYFKKDIILIRNLLKYCKKYNMNFIFLPKYSSSKGLKEIQFYLKEFNNSKIKFIRKKDKSPTIYKIADNSMITITTTSTFGFENIARGNDTAIFNNKIEVSKKIMDIFWNFNFKKKGYFWSNKCNFEEVERVLNFYLKRKKRLTKLGFKKITSGLMIYDKNNKILKKTLLQFF